MLWTCAQRQINELTQGQGAVNSQGMTWSVMCLYSTRSHRLCFKSSWLQTNSCNRLSSTSFSLSGAGLGRCQRSSRDSANHSPGAKSGPPPGFVNKVLLEHSHIHSFTYCTRVRLPMTTAQLNHCDRDHTAYKWKICAICPFTGKKKKCQSLVRTWKEKSKVQRKSSVTHQKKPKLLSTEGKKQERTRQAKWHEVSATLSGRNVDF